MFEKEDTNWHFYVVYKVIFKKIQKKLQFQQSF